MVRKSFSCILADSEIQFKLKSHLMKQAFPPIVDADSRILILGTMPGERSLLLQQYYGHPGNHFWKILFRLFDREFTTDYTKRVALLHEKHIALWDVLEYCEGEGSADSAIRNEIPNDFHAFHQAHPHIRHVFFASKQAEKFYRKYATPEPGISYATLPSPSGAYASKSLAKKQEEWAVIKEWL